MKTRTHQWRYRLCTAAVILLVCSRTASAATYTVQVGGDGPFFSPAGLSIQPGDTVKWDWNSPGFFHSVTSGVNGTPNGLFDSGIHGNGFTFSFTFPNPGTFDYYCQPHLSMGMVGRVTVAGATTPAQPLNISTRARVQLNENVMIGGFIVTGSEPKRLIIRAIGPSLEQFGLTDVLADPRIELRAANGDLIRSNDNWKDTQRAEIEATTLPPSNDLEAAMVVSLAPARYTAIVSGTNNGTGVGVVDVYDLKPAAQSKLANISTRGFVQTGNNLMIGGFILGKGIDPARVIIRAIGPSLTQFGINNALPDSTLELRNANGALVRSNDNWKDTQQAEIQATGLPPSNDLEAAIVATLTPAPYTAIVAGKNNVTGIAVVEVYQLP